MDTKTKRICLWSGPRNISTALMYSFAQRDDTTVVDEPFYAHYLSHTDARRYHPGAEEVIAHQESNQVKVIQEVIFGEYNTPVVFFKQMTHHLEGLNWDFLKHTVNVILIRDPRDMLPSYAKQVKQPTLRDTGYAEHIELLNYLQKHGQDPPVVDSRDILLNPEGTLSKLCKYIGISFNKAMLSWEAGPRPEDGVWAKYWYHSVHESIGFKPYKPKTNPFPDHLKALLEECLPYYEELKKMSI